jgi:hypothetical protein
VVARMVRNTPRPKKIKLRILPPMLKVVAAIPIHEIENLARFSPP